MDKYVKYIAKQGDNVIKLKPDGSTGGSLEIMDHLLKDLPRDGAVYIPVMGRDYPFCSVGDI